jgi:hypothetical protein
MSDPLTIVSFDDWFDEQMRDPEFARAYRRYQRPWLRAWHWVDGWVSLLWEMFWEAVDG